MSLPVNAVECMMRTNVVLITWLPILNVDSTRHSGFYLYSDGGNYAGGNFNSLLV
uniref:Uncharacterized protein n=1 Tax=Glycine max TaxID=3847 RepID=C6T661_SOYBN|nr:unknown [Glycine max]